MRLMPAAFTRTTTSPGPGWGIGRSSTCSTSGDPCCDAVTTRMLSLSARWGGLRVDRGVSAIRAWWAGGVGEHAVHLGCCGVGGEQLVGLLVADLAVGAAASTVELLARKVDRPAPP